MSRGDFPAWRLPDSAHGVGRITPYGKPVEWRIDFVPTDLRIAAKRILVIMPNWLGDAVMATPFLRALRDRYPQAHIAALASDRAATVLDGLPFIDSPLRYSGTAPGGRNDRRSLVARLAAERYDLAVLLPNSFRSAYLAWRAGIPRRLGYRRDYRGMLLSDRLSPLKRCDEDIDWQLIRSVVRTLVGAGAAIQSVVPESLSVAGRRSWRLLTADGAVDRRLSIAAWRRRLARRGNYQPVSAIDYYLALAGYLGASRLDDRRMELGITHAERAEALEALRELQLADSTAPGFLLLFPGASFGTSKCWMPDRFAEVAAAVSDPRGDFAAPVLLAGAPVEKPLLDAVLIALRQLPQAAVERVHLLAAVRGGRGLSLGALKEMVRRASLVLCHDTGPRHFAAALGTPLVTLFGPTDPRWANTYYARERQLQIPVACGPCQLKRCPIDHRCMRGLTAPMVLAAVRELWRKSAP